MRIDAKEKRKDFGGALARPSLAIDNSVPLCLCGESIIPQSPPRMRATSARVAASPGTLLPVNQSISTWSG